MIGKAPRKLGAAFAFTMAAPLPFLPAEWHGKPASAVIARWSGALERGEKAVAPLRRLGPVVGELVGRMPYPQLNTLFDELLPAGLSTTIGWWRSRAAMIRPTSSASITTSVRFLELEDRRSR